MVLRNLRRFTMPEFAHEYPFCSQLMSGFERPLAALRGRAVPRHRQGAQLFITVLPHIQPSPPSNAEFLRYPCTYAFPAKTRRTAANFNAVPYSGGFVFSRLRSPIEQLVTIISVSVLGGCSSPVCPQFSPQFSPGSDRMATRIEMPSTANSASCAPTEWHSLDWACRLAADLHLLFREGVSYPQPSQPLTSQAPVPI